ncbi:hypothetical protein KQI68_06515 [Peptoniphilus sp. MSJ-1]|uniref:Uncharacterized protein n=1 Tax=Peptoniphilus ovalis TaxID=2841503 RepID=A0ABS6FH55_9FIRM|nr:hypothetical protein [Peptoniphilus ovalis]MBU5669490.1 hypothetical protein [Peptoniphilus ovalis]
MDYQVFEGSGYIIHARKLDNKYAEVIVNTNPEELRSYRMNLNLKSSLIPKETTCEYKFYNAKDSSHTKYPNTVIITDLGEIQILIQDSRCAIMASIVYRTR